MLKNLKLLLSLRAWLKSRTLNLAAILGAIATVDVTAGTGMVQFAIDFIANTFGVMQGTAIAIVVAAREVANAVLRAKTDKSLEQK